MSEIAIVLAADDNFARPLAVTIRSIIANLGPSRTLRLWILDMGIAAGNRDLLHGILSDSRVKVTWDDSLVDRVDHLPNTWTAISRATYARLFLAEVAPQDAERVLYLDTDLVVRRCVGDLFDSDLNGSVALAVPDGRVPFVSASWGVPWWYEAGRSADDLNFNAGVMLIDLAQWRRLDVSTAALAYLTDGRHYTGQDQEALNATLAGRIMPVDPRWNQQTHIFTKDFEAILPYTREVVSLIKTEPWIVHFSTPEKPWMYGNDHPFAHEWFRCLDETPFAGWRPAPPPRRMRAVASVRRAARPLARRLGLA
jgi:lipopolysaccharide biosynthesis glycosyltransferase